MQTFRAKAGVLWGCRHGYFGVPVQMDSSSIMSKKQVKMAGVEGADSAPTASTTPKEQYIAPEQMP
jgi:hypothetical protein